MDDSFWKDLFELNYIDTGLGPFLIQRMKEKGLSPHDVSKALHIEAELLNLWLEGVFPESMVHFVALLEILELNSHELMVGIKNQAMLLKEGQKK